MPVCLRIAAKLTPTDSDAGDADHSDPGWWRKQRHVRRAHPDPQQTGNDDNRRSKVDQREQVLLQTADERTQTIVPANRDGTLSQDCPSSVTGSLERLCQPVVIIDRKREVGKPADGLEGGSAHQVECADAEMRLPVGPTRPPSTRDANASAKIV